MNAIKNNTAKLKIKLEEIHWSVGANVFNQTWTQLLCNTEQHFAIFKNEFLEKEHFTNSLLSFRKFLIDSGRGQDIDIQSLKQQFNNNLEDCVTQLQELFLEPIQTAEMQILKIAIAKGCTAEEIVTAHKADKYSRFISVVKKTIGKKWRY